MDDDIRYELKNVNLNLDFLLRIVTFGGIAVCVLLALILWRLW